MKAVMPVMGKYKKSFGVMFMTVYDMTVCDSYDKTWAPNCRWTEKHTIIQKLQTKTMDLQELSRFFGKPLEVSSYYKM